MRVNKYLDFAERVGWTAIQAAAGATLIALSGAVSWESGLKFVGVTTATAALKVIVAQQVGDRGSGDAIPGGVTKT